MRAAKVDTNHAQIVTALRECGWIVVSTARMGGGFPDAVVHRRESVGAAGEIKTAKGDLTPDQREFHALFPVSILRTPEDAVALR